MDTRPYNQIFLSSDDVGTFSNLSSLMNFSSAKFGVIRGTIWFKIIFGLIRTTARIIFLKSHAYHWSPDRNRAEIDFTKMPVFRNSVTGYTATLDWPDHWLPFITASVDSCLNSYNCRNASDGFKFSDKNFPTRYPSCIAWFARCPSAGDVAWAASPMRQIRSLLQYGKHLFW